MKIFSILNFIAAVILILTIARFDYFIGSAELLFMYILLIINDIEFAGAQMSLSFADTLISLILLICCIIALPVLYKKNILKNKLTFVGSVIILLMMFFVFAPAVSSYHPEFQKNISVTKLLPPLSKVLLLNISNKTAPDNLKDNFLIKKKDVVRQSFNDRIIFATAVSDNEPYSYFQNNKEISLQEKPVVRKSIFLLGTDQYGRDIFSRLVYGARISLFIGMGAVIVSFILGFGLGFAAGYPGGILDIIINRTADIFLSFPLIFLIILILALFGNSLFTIIIVLGLSGWMSMFKIVRSEIMGIKHKDYFISARMAGLSPFQLMFKEALPVAAIPVIVNLIFQFANVILAEAALSYLGLGSGGSYPSWGSMIESSQGYLPQGWWMIIAPGVLLIVTLYSANEMGKSINQKILRRAYD